MPREPSDDESDAAQPDSLQRFEFVRCALRDPLGKSALLLALQQQPVLAAMHAAKRNAGDLAFPSAASPGWLGRIPDWQVSGPRCPPTCELGVLGAHYTAHYVREHQPEFASGRKFDRSELNRPMFRGLKRIVQSATQPDVNVHVVCEQADGTGVTWLSGHVAASQSVATLYQCKVAVQCVALPAAAAVAAGVVTRGATAAQAAAPEVAWVMRDCAVGGVPVQAAVELRARGELAVGCDFVGRVTG